MLPRPTNADSPQSLVDVAADGQGHLYLADLLGNAIYRLDLTPALPLSLYVSGSHLAGPSGVAVHPKTGHVVVVSYDSGKIFDITPEGALTELVERLFHRPFSESERGRFRSLGQHVCGGRDQGENLADGAR